MQSYATLFMEGNEDDNPTFFSMKNGTIHSCDKRKLCETLGLKFESQEIEDIQFFCANRLEMPNKEIFLNKFYKKDVVSTLWNTKNLMDSCFTLQNMLRLTLCPKMGDSTNTRGPMRNLF